MIKPNWDKFKEKFNDNPTWYFEYFCYLLFCIEYNKPQGVFRYKNQTGTEWDPIEIDGKTIVAQCKFYDTTLGSNKDKIIEMLDNIYKNYHTPCELKFYTNQDWGQGKKKGINDSQPKIEIAAKAKEYNITIDWRTNEAYFLSPDVAFNQDLMKHFFTDESVYDLVDAKKNHTKRVLENIKNKIVFNSIDIELDRTDVVNELKEKINTNNMLIVSGVGGVGKTAVIKSLYEQTQEDRPFYLFKANEFNKTNVNELFEKYSIEKFIEIHQTYEDKIIVIDSAEKLLDIDNLDVFIEFLTTFIQNAWKVIFTTRDYYVDILNNEFSELLNTTAYNFHINIIDSDTLLNLSEQYKFSLPNDIKLESLIKNPFYLNEYLLSYKQDEQLDYQAFKQKLWKKNIKNPNSEQCFLKLAFKRANESNFFINIECQSNSLEELRKDGVLGYESSGYFISHDIYEEWALEKIIEREFINRSDNHSFFMDIGSSLPIRRSFRSWVSEKLLLNNEDIKSFIGEIIDTKDIESFWKDEVFISILLSEYSDTFFSNFDRELKADDFALLKRLSFLLRLACKEVDNSLIEQYKLNGTKKLEMFHLFNIPKGSGWKSFISFVLSNIDSIELKGINFILPIIYEWNSKHKNGEATRYASLIALSYYESLNDNNDKLIRTILYGANEIKNELESIFKNVIENEYRNSRDPYYYLCKQLLTQMESVNVTQLLPNYILQVSDLFWFKPQKRKVNSFNRYDYDIEERYSLVSEYDFKYFPASAFQTPIYWCLKTEQHLTLDFILGFTNKTIENFVNSNENINEVKFYIDEEEIVQVHSSSLWGMYRGLNSSPYLLQSIHMALEKYLLEISRSLEQESLEVLLTYLLLKSKSSSITAVVASIVVAYPEKTFNIAVILFKVKEFLECDFSRSTQEHIPHFDGAYDTMSKIHSLERAEELKRQHRKESLSGMMFKYQLINSEDGLEKKKLIENIIDDYYIDIEKEPSQTQSWKLFILTKIDVRKMDMKYEKTSTNENIISFTPQLDEKSKDYQQSVLKDIDDSNKYNQLSMWADYKLKNDDKFKKYDIYSSNIPLVFSSIKEILVLLEDGNYNRLFIEEIPAKCSCILLRDYNANLTGEEKVFFKEIFYKHIFNTFDNSTNIEYYINILPSLINIFPEEKNNIKFKLLKLLRLGYGIVTMMEMWDIYYKDIYSIIIAYLLLEPLYDLKYDKYRNKRYENRFGENFTSTSVWDEVLKENNEILEKMNSDELLVEHILDFNSIDIDILSKAFTILPDEMNTQEVEYLSFKLSFAIANKLLTDKNDKIGFQTKDNFCIKLSYIMLNSEIDKIDIYLEPILKNFNNKEIIATLFNELIKAQNTLVKYDHFWYIWEKLEDNVIELCKNGDIFAFINNIVHSYLFSSNNILGQGIFSDQCTSWHSLKERDKRFFKRMSESIGHCPSALYSISKLLTNVGSIYSNDGISWIAEILRNNANLFVDKLEVNTIYYIETLIRKYIFENTDKIKKEKKTRENVLVILHFLIEKGSSLGYMLREKVL